MKFPLAPFLRSFFALRFIKTFNRTDFCVKSLFVTRLRDDRLHTRVSRLHRRIGNSLSQGEGNEAKVEAGNRINRRVRACCRDRWKIPSWKDETIERGEPADARSEFNAEINDTIH